MWFFANHSCNCGFWYLLTKFVFVFRPFDKIGDFYLRTIEFFSSSFCQNSWKILGPNFGTNDRFFKLFVIESLNFSEILEQYDFCVWDIANPTQKRKILQKEFFNRILQIYFIRRHVIWSRILFLNFRENHDFFSFVGEKWRIPQSTVETYLELYQRSSKQMAIFVIQSRKKSSQISSKVYSEITNFV